VTTSGTQAFNLDLNNLIEEAFERCGAELRTGYDMRTARRSLNLLTIEWANRGINLWTIEEGSIPMVQGQITYDLPVDTIDLLDSVIRTSSGTGRLTSTSAVSQSVLMPRSPTKTPRADRSKCGLTGSQVLQSQQRGLTFLKFMYGLPQTKVTCTPMSTGG
jgi:hypothetical protein